MRKAKRIISIFSLTVIMEADAEKELVAMTYYMVKQNGGKSQYQDVGLPVTKEFHEKLYDAFIDCYQQERDKVMNQGMEQTATQSMERAEMRLTDRRIPFR